MENTFSDRIKTFGPFYQGLVSIILISIICLTCLILNKRNIEAFGIILSPVFLFCFYNPFLGILHENRLKYILKSILVFIIIWLVVIVSGCYITSTKFNSIDQIQIIIIVDVLFYIMLIILSFVFSGILSFLDNADN